MLANRCISVFTLKFKWFHGKFSATSMSCLPLLKLYLNALATNLLFSIWLDVPLSLLLFKSAVSVIDFQLLLLRQAQRHLCFQEVQILNFLGRPPL